MGDGIRIPDGAHKVRDAHHDLHNTCLVCYRGCDTCVGLIGTWDWMVGALTALGVPDAEAQITVNYIIGHPGAEGPVEGEFKLLVTFCQACVDRSGVQIELSNRDAKQGIKAFIEPKWDAEKDDYVEGP